MGSDIRSNDVQKGEFPDLNRTEKRKPKTKFSTVTERGNNRDKAERVGRKRWSIERGSLED